MKWFGGHLGSMTAIKLGGIASMNWQKANTVPTACAL
jgi:hypothetical protein